MEISLSHHSGLTKWLTLEELLRQNMGNERLSFVWNQRINLDWYYSLDYDIWCFIEQTDGDTPP